MELEQILETIEKHPGTFIFLIISIFLVCIPVFVVRIKYNKK